MNDLIFSWAKDAYGRMVHVDSVDHGLKCGCFCPCCHERLQARHGEIRAHGFAHHSETRRVNLNICYMVTMYKLAEQIILEEKKIHTPSYYGIFMELDLEFSEVVVDDRYDRADKQPDVIATTTDGTQYLIEFTFAAKVQHINKIDYTNLICLEIDLSSQTLESLRDFLLHSNEGRKWINNQFCFDNIIPTYSKFGKSVSVKKEMDCNVCKFRHKCCGVKQKGQNNLLKIENNGLTYRICKTQEYEYLKQQAETRKLPHNQELQEQQEQSEFIEAATINPELKSCFMCQRNLGWRCRDEYAHCGAYQSMKVPSTTPPETARTCKGFRPKHSN